MRSGSYEGRICLPSLLGKAPCAVATVKGSGKYPEIKGSVRLYETLCGIVIESEFTGLPYREGDCTGRFFAFHIHTGKSCSGTGEDPFSDALTHYNPKECEHPYHAGDMPPLLGNKGYALSVFLTDRFKLSEIIGRTVIIHSGIDDFTSQPAGNAGEKIACGVIRKC